MLTLQQLREDARRGYIADSNKIAQILEKVANLSWGQVLDSIADKEDKEDAILLVGAACELHGIYAMETEQIRSLSYTELVCLLEDIKLGNNKEAHKNYMALMDFLMSALQKSRGQLFVLEQFFMVGVEELFQYLKMKSLSKEAEHYSCSYTHDIYNRYKWIMDEDDLAEDIEKALNKMKKCRWVAWNPRTDLNDYKRRVEEVYEVWDILLIQSFFAAYPERFQLKDVLSRLRT